MPNIYRQEVDVLPFLWKGALYQAPVCHDNDNLNIMSPEEVKRLPKVELRPGESQEQLLRRFRKKVVKSQVLSSARRKRWHIPKSELKRIKMKKAIRRARRRNRR